MKKFIKKTKKLLVKLSYITVAVSSTFIAPTSAMYQDIEASTDNTIETTTLDIGMRSGQNDFYPLNTLLLPRNSLTRDIYLQKLGIDDADYRSSYEYTSGDSDLCSALQLTVYYNWYDALPAYPNYHSHRHMDLKYNGPLSSFTDFDSNHPTHDPDMRLLNSKTYYSNIFYAANEQWFFYSISLPVSASPSIQNKTCSFNIKTTAWQTNLPDETDGFFDIESISNTITTGNWAICQNLTGTVKDTNGNGINGINISAHRELATPAETLTVDSHNPAGATSGITLLSGRKYLIEATGEWTNMGGSQQNDATYYSFDHWVTHADYDDDLAWDPRIVDLVINDTDIDWGSYNSPHRYLAVIDGTGATANFKISEAGGPPSWYDDNSGSLTVKIFDVTDNTVTIDSSGAYSVFACGSGDFDLVQKFQTGWKQTSPTGPSFYHLSYPLPPATTYDFTDQNTLYLNEVLFNPNGDDSTGEFVELYNTSRASVDLNNWKIRDKDGTETTLTGSIAGHGFFVVYFDGDYFVNTADTVTLLDNLANLRDRIGYTTNPPDANGTTVINVSAKPEGHSLARLPNDGTSPWVDPIPSPGRPNSEVPLEILPTPTEASELHPESDRGTTEAPTEASSATPTIIEPSPTEASELHPESVEEQQ